MESTLPKHALKPFVAVTRTVTVMDAIKQSGISNVSIVTQPIDGHARSH